MTATRIAIKIDKTTGAIIIFTQRTDWGIIQMTTRKLDRSLLKSVWDDSNNHQKDDEDQEQIWRIWESQLNRPRIRNGSMIVSWNPKTSRRIAIGIQARTTRRIIVTKRFIGTILRKLRLTSSTSETKRTEIRRTSSWHWWRSSERLSLLSEMIHEWNCAATTRILPRLWRQSLKQTVRKTVESDRECSLHDYRWNIGKVGTFVVLTLLDHLNRKQSKKKRKECDQQTADPLDITFRIVHLPSSDIN